MQNQDEDYGPIWLNICVLQVWFVLLTEGVDLSPIASPAMGKFIDSFKFNIGMFVF